jgi:hypothetical protein
MRVQTDKTGNPGTQLGIIQPIGKPLEFAFNGGDSKTNRPRSILKPSRAIAFAAFRFLFPEIRI